MTRLLESASRRLRGVAGFPRAIGRPRKPLESGDSVVTAPPEPRVNGSASERAQATPASAQVLAASPWPRLLTLPRAADYLGLGIDVTRELARSGALRAARVTIPAPTTAKRKGDRIALVMLDRLILDDLVTTWRNDG